MCGIVGIFDIRENAQEQRKKALKMVQKIRHRGPDWSGIYGGERAVLAHERLSIVDPQSGGQPLYSPDKKKVLAVNGEIYNHRDIRRRLADAGYQFQTGSDCEVILALYEETRREHAGDWTWMLEQLNGIFAFALYDETNDEYLIARDPIGVIPLYIGRHTDGTLCVASELKALEGQCAHYRPFLPGHYLWSGTKSSCSASLSKRLPTSPGAPQGNSNSSPFLLRFSTQASPYVAERTLHPSPQRYYHRDWMDFEAVRDNPADLDALRVGLQEAVRRQLMSDVPYGVLLSGGLDSSVVSAIARKFAAKRIETDSQHDAWWPRLHSFAIGLEGAPDLAMAREVADHIGTVHHEIHYTTQEGLDAISDVIYYTETYDVTTVRASTPMYLLARVIKSMGIKMVLSGEGADEIFGGYLYFHKAPSAQAFHEETVRKLMKLHWYDCLRANKSLAAWGVEGRVPFLDKEFLDIAMRMNPEAKMCPGQTIEKRLVREAFADMLPESVAWRQKEQFSDGVGYSWIDTLKEFASAQVSDYQMAHARERFPVNPPLCKEEYLYRSLFEEHFPSESAALCVNQEASVACSTAVALQWDKAWAAMNDPSGRAVAGVHRQAY